MAKKKCSKCGDPRPLGQFNNNAAKPDGKQSWCKRCCAAQKKTPSGRASNRISFAKWHKEQKTDDPAGYYTRRREYNLRYLYDLSPQEYEQLHRKQKGLCAICKQPETARLRGVLRRLSVDHCHREGHIRGLLCCRCNRMIGMVRDDISLLRLAIAYLKSQRRT